MDEKLKRKYKEIALDLFYAKYLAHGTDGHNARLILAEHATELGYALDIQTLCLSRHGAPLLVLEEIP